MLTVGLWQFRSRYGCRSRCSSLSSSSSSRRRTTSREMWVSYDLRQCIQIESAFNNGEAFVIVNSCDKKSTTVGPLTDAETHRFTLINFAHGLQCGSDHDIVRRSQVYIYE